MTNGKTLRHLVAPAFRDHTSTGAMAADFFADFKEATVELQQMVKGKPLSARLVSEHAVRRLREKIRV
ncbi:MAG: hypothetical protein A3I06_10760 [Candidatus Lindowbacteria bacterium RIFCSPLOWO2_02_FULL_62_12]|nr:MAG: hypothetical protein A3I06_10760 [Candidatus Lindowbacteria bacterium RIFCSPLOWO2_02_FULL_62_12]